MDDGGNMKTGYKYLVSALGGAVLGAALVYLPAATISNLSEAYQRTHPKIVYEQKTETRVLDTLDGRYLEEKSYEFRLLPTPVPETDEEEEESDLGIKLLGRPSGLERVVNR
jgi:hypothetical protein